MSRIFGLDSFIYKCVFIVKQKGNLSKTENNYSTPHDNTMKMYVRVYSGKQILVILTEARYSSRQESGQSQVQTEGGTQGTIGGVKHVHGCATQVEQQH